MYELTQGALSRYAQRIGADFVIIDEFVYCIQSNTPHFEKSQIHDIMVHYERGIFLDGDVVVKRGADNLFDIVPDTHIGAFNEFSMGNSNVGVLRREVEESQSALGDVGWRVGDFVNTEYVNSGVVVLSQQHRRAFLFDSDRLYVGSFRDQTQFNYNVQRERFPLYHLPEKYNRMEFCAIGKDEAHIIHYAGISDCEWMLYLVQADLDRPIRTKAVANWAGWPLPEWLRPFIDSWSPTEEELRALAAIVSELRPCVIVETGSGASTLLFAFLIKELGLKCELFVLEDSVESCARTRAILEVHSLQCNLVYAPIEIRCYFGKYLPAYGVESLPIQGKADLVFIDGPNGLRYGREAVLYQLEQYIGANTIIVLHDAARRNIEQEHINQWKGIFQERMTVEYHLESAIDDHFRGKGWALITLRAP